MRKAAELHAYICKVLEQAEQNSFHLTDIAYRRYREGCKLVGRTPFPDPEFAEYRIKLGLSEVLKEAEVGE